MRSEKEEGAFYLSFLGLGMVNLMSILLFLRLKLLFILPPSILPFSHHLSLPPEFTPYIASIDIRQQTAAHVLLVLWYAAVGSEPLTSSP